MASGERIAVRMSGRFSFLIDEGLGQLCQGLVGLLLFGESSVQQLDRRVHPEFARPGLQGAVAGNLVVFDGLRR